MDITLEQLFDSEGFDLRRMFYTDCIDNLDESYELIQIDYRDGLTDEQVVALASRDWEALDESMESWLSDAMFEGADYHRTKIIEHVERQWVESHGEALAAAVRAEFECSDLCDELRYAIEDRDISNPTRDLAGHTGRVLMRQVMGEARWNEFGSDDFDTRREFVLDLLNDLGVKPTAYNQERIELTLTECGDYVAAMIVYAVDASDLYDTMNADEVEIVNPFLYLGNPYVGDGFCEEQLVGRVTLRRDELTTDKGAFGYGWDEVAGVYVSAYEAEMVAVPKPADDGDGMSRPVKEDPNDVSHIVEED